MVFVPLDESGNGMKAAIFKEYGASFEIGEVVKPTEVKEDEVIVKVKSTAINPADYKIRDGVLKIVTGKKFPQTTGHDFSGIVTQVGAKVSELKVGDEVYGMTGTSETNGTFCEYVRFGSHCIAKKATTQSWNEAAAVPVAGLTAYDSIIKYAKLTPGQNILILGAGCSVGMFGVQFAKLSGAKIWATCSAEKAELVKSLGADYIIDYKKEDLIQALGDQKMDVVFDAVGASVDRNKSFSVVKSKGKIITSNPADFNTKLYFTDIVRLAADVAWKMAWNWMTGGPSYIVVRLVERELGGSLKQIAKLVEEGKVKSVIDSVFSFDKMEEASRRAASPSVRGKVVVEISK